MLPACHQKKRNGQCTERKNIRHHILRSIKGFCLNFDIFLSKMEYYGTAGTPLALVKSYLTYRYQYVHFENCKSELLEIVVSLTEIITNVDEVDLIMFNSISKSNTKSNKNNLDVVQLAASVRMICIQ